MNELSPVKTAPPPPGRSDGKFRSAAYPSFTARDFLTALFYVRRALTIAFLVPLALGIVAAFLSHTMYTAQARLLVLYGSEYVFRPAVGQAGSGIALDRNQIMQGETQILQSTTLAIETLRQVGVQHVYPGTDLDRPGAMELAAARFERDLTVNAIAQSNVIELGFQNIDRDVAAATLRALIDRYLVRRSTVFQKSAPNAADDQRGKYAARLREAEDALTAFGAAHGITDLAAQTSLLLNQKSSVIDQQHQAEQSIQETAARLETLRRQVATMPMNVQMFADSERSQQSTGLTDSLTRLQIQRHDLLARYQDDFPLVQDVDRRIAALRAQIAASPGRESGGVRLGRNPVWEQLDTQRAQLETDLHGLQARRTELTATAASLQARLDELDGLGQQYRDLVQARDVLAETFRTFSLNSEEATLGDALERSRAANIRVVQPPEPPPTGRSLRLLLLAGGLLLGGIAAAATLAVLNALRQVFVSVHDAERGLDLPVLVAVPFVAAAEKPGRR